MFPNQNKQCSKVCKDGCKDECEASKPQCGESLPPPSPPPQQQLSPPPPPPGPPCVQFSPAELTTQESACEDAFGNQIIVCRALPTKAERKSCKQQNVQYGIACDASLYCPPVGTKPTL